MKTTGNKRHRRKLTEDEPNDEEGCIVDTSGWRCSTRSVQEYGKIDVLQSCVWESTLIIPEWEWSECTGEESPQEDVV
jgi:hypothetical protein